MKIQATKIPGCVIIEPEIFKDERGFFMETFRASRYATQGLPGKFLQDNFSQSTQSTLRGLHYQLEKPQGKLVQVTRGKIYDVAVDLRQDSPTFGQWEAIVLSEYDRKQFYVPPGCAHGFYVISKSADVTYKCTEAYSPESEQTLLWDDPDLKIEWPLNSKPLLSEKDLAGIALKQCKTF